MAFVHSACFCKKKKKSPMVDFVLLLKLIQRKKPYIGVITFGTKFWLAWQWQRKKLFPFKNLHTHTNETETFPTCSKLIRPISPFNSDPRGEQASTFSHWNQNETQTTGTLSQRAHWPSRQQKGSQRGNHQNSTGNCKVI